MLQYVDVKRIRHHYDGHIHFYIRLMGFSLGCNCFKCTKNGGTVKELFCIIRIGAGSEKKSHAWRAWLKVLRNAI